MNIKAINITLHFFIAFSIILFSSQRSLADELKHKITVNNSNIKEIIKKLSECSGETFSANLKIVEESTYCLNTVKLEFISNLFGSEFIYDLNNNGFSVNEYTTMEELFNTPDPDGFITNWVANNPQKIALLCNKISKKRNKTIAPTPHYTFILVRNGNFQ